jgi:CRISPR-associated protein Csn2
MKLTHPMFSKPIELKENQVNVLIIENQNAWRSLIMDLIAQIEGKEGEFVLSKDYTPLTISKEMVLVINPLCLQWNDKRILKKLHNELNEIAYGEEYLMDTMDIRMQIGGYISKITRESDYSLSFDMEINILSLFKAVEMRFNEDNTSFIENIIDYLSVYQKLINIKCFVFINLKSFLNEEDFKELYQFIEYEKIWLILMESSTREKFFPQEVIRIIDQDLCEID